MPNRHQRVTDAGARYQATPLKDAIAPWQRYHAGGVDDHTREARNITQAIDRHLKPWSLDDPDNQRLLDQIG